MHFMWFTERAYHYDLDTHPREYNELEDEIVRKRSFYGTPNRFVNTPQFGSITEAATSARQIQFVFRAMF